MVTSAQNLTHNITFRTVRKWLFIDAVGQGLHWPGLTIQLLTIKAFGGMIRGLINSITNQTSAISIEENGLATSQAQRHTQQKSH